MNVNLRHQFFAAQAVRPQMKELGYGSIINFSSIAWMSGAPHMVVYTTAKSAVIGLTTTLGREFGPDNIRVNAIAPGAVVTDKQLRLWYSTKRSIRWPGGRPSSDGCCPSDVARAALFLAADDSDMITKQYLVVDGGLR